MKIKTQIKLVPMVLCGLLATSTGYIKKNKDEIFYKYLHFNNKPVAMKIKDNNKINNMNDDLSYYVLAMENSYIYDMPNARSDKVGILVKGECIKYLGV